MKEYAKPFYFSQAWIKCRNTYMISKYYICERCGGPALIVHHKEHITPKNINDVTVTLNWDNLKAVCLECHNKEHGQGDCIVDGLEFDGEGNILTSPPGRV